ncbi:MAG: hypothetical protein JST63_00315 [Bacteroidetes bacterium]|nr:hypothetical protein [Bacteroidota bacterium]
MQTISIITTIAFFLPLIMLMVRNLIQDRILIWFAAFWAWSGLANILFSFDFVTTNKVMLILQRVYNLFDFPILLFVLFKTTYIKEVRNSIGKIMLPFFIIETVTIAISGFENMVESILVFAGVLIALYYIGWIILLHMKGTHYSNYQHAMQFIYYALFFEYGVSTINFIYSYILPDKVSEADNFLIFYMASCITILIALYGILVYKEKIPPKQKKIKKPEREMEIRFL